jgi:hypothetical protein
MKMREKGISEILANFDHSHKIGRRKEGMRKG